jgi:hypothetical protein
VNLARHIRQSERATLFGSGRQQFGRICFRADRDIARNNLSGVHKLRKRGGQAAEGNRCFAARQIGDKIVARCPEFPPQFRFDVTLRHLQPFEKRSGTTMGRFPEYPLTPLRQVGAI